MSETRQFELGAVISAATGRFVARKGMGAIQEVFEHITGRSVWTHQLPRLFDECQESLNDQFPWMRDIVFPDDLDATNWERWLDEQAAIHGTTLGVKPLNADQFTVVDPIQELTDMMGPGDVSMVAIII